MSGVSSITNSMIRSSEHLVEGEMTPNRTIPRALLENLYTAPVTGRAISLLQTGAVAGNSLARARKVSCPQYEMILQMADEIGFKPQEKLFIQFHVIGQERYIFVADSHHNPHFESLEYRLMELAMKKKISLFQEAVCQDARSFQDYSRTFGARGVTVYGLEGEERPLCTLAHCFSCYNPPQFVAEQEPVENAGTEETPSDQSRNPGLAKLGSFLDELHFNTPWERVIALGQNRMPNPAAAALFKDILKIVATPMTICAKSEQEYPKLFAQYPNAKVWCDVFVALMNICLMHPLIAGHFSPAELGCIVKLRDNPQDSVNYSLFYQKVSIARRDRSFAQALFNHPHGVVRVARMGYEHLPGTLAELQRLASKR